MTRAALAEKSKPETQQALFKARKDGTLEYCGEVEPPSEEEEGQGREWAAVRAWHGLDATIDEGIWGQASIAASIQPIYGKETMKTFGERVEKTPQYLKKMARTYRYFVIENETRVSNLYFKHHTIALRHKDPAKALQMAAENRWNCLKLEQWIFERSEEEAGVPPESRVSPEVVNALIKWNEHVEELIEDDFIALCPDKKYGLRVFGAWLEDLRGENKRLYLDDLHSEIVDAIEKRGARTIPELQKATGAKRGDVEAVVSQLIHEEEYEWIEQRGETDEARGSAKTILHKFGAPHGGACNVPRGGYDPNIAPGVAHEDWD